MRLQKLTTHRENYVRRFYAKHPGLASESYDTQYAALMADCYGWADFWSLALNKLGYEAKEIIADVEPMQKRWASENGVGYSENGWLLEITTAQVKAFRPDVLFVDDYTIFTAAYLRQLRSECPSVGLILGWCGAPYSDPSVFREYDIVLSCVPELVQHFRDSGHRCYHLHHAFEPRILAGINAEAPPDADFAFIGSIVKLDDFHNERERLLTELVKKTNLQIWSDLYRPTPRLRRSVGMRRYAHDLVQLAQRVGVPQTLLSAMPLVRKVNRWKSRPGFPQYFNDRIIRRAHEPLFGLAMFQQLHNSKVALNTHIDISPLSASNMRLFEATGVGTCLLTDWKVNLPELFEPDVEVVTYRSSEECIEKVRYLLEHEDERKSIATAGQRRTLRDHTFAQRAEALSDLICSYFRR